MPLAPDTGHPGVPPSHLSSPRRMFSTGPSPAFPCYLKTNGPQPVFSGLLPCRLSGHSHCHSDAPQSWTPTLSHLHSSSSPLTALFLQGPLSGDEEPHLGILGGLLDPSLQLSAHSQPRGCSLTLTFHLLLLSMCSSIKPTFPWVLFPSEKSQGVTCEVWLSFSVSPPSSFSVPILQPS